MGSNEEKKIINCPDCGGVVAKDFIGELETKIKCPHCGSKLKIKTKKSIIVESN